MQNFWGITPFRLAIVLGFSSLALALAQLGLPAIGYELSPWQGYTLLILAALFGVGALVALIWAWVGPLVHKIRRIRVRWPFVLTPAKATTSPKLEQLIAERDALKEENEQLKTLGEPLAQRIGYWRNRKLLKTALGEAYKHGLFWRGYDPSDQNLVNWTERTYALIEDALGKEEADLFVTDQKMPSVSGEAGGERWMDQRLQRLAELQQRVDSLAPLELRPEFDGREWVSKK